jgi:hypothetical protein
MLESIHNTLRVKPFVLHSAQVLLVVPLSEKEENEKFSESNWIEVKEKFLMK